MIPTRSPTAFPSCRRARSSQINTDSVDWQNNFQLARNWQITAGIQADNTDVNQFTDYNDFDFPPVMGMTTLENSLFNIGGYVESQWQPHRGPQRAQFRPRRSLLRLFGRGFVAAGRLLSHRADRHRRSRLRRVVLHAALRCRTSIIPALATRT